MDRKVAIVTHHYVRDVQDPSESRIGRYSTGVNDFIKRLDYFMKQYEIISPEIFIDSIENKVPLPKNSMLLTFDDGYIDHFNVVFPILMDRGLKAFFFPSALPVLEGKMLNTNKLQIIFDGQDKNSINDEVLKLLKKSSDKSTVDYFENLTQNSSTDQIADTLLSYLEWEAPIFFSNKIIDILFNRIAGLNEREMCRRFYMNISQLKYMKEKGMHIGCHGYNHYCLSKISERVRYFEIKKSMRLINEINGNSSWVMCYPYGSNDDSLIPILKNLGCIAAFTTIDATADLNLDDSYKLPRVDVSSSKL